MFCTEIKHFYMKSILLLQCCENNVVACCQVYMRLIARGGLVFTESTNGVQLLYLLFITLFQLLWQLHIWKAESLLLPLTSLYIRIMVCLLCDMQPFCLLFLIFIRSFHSKRYSFMTVQFTGTRSTKRINTTRKLLGLFQLGSLFLLSGETAPISGFLNHEAWKFVFLRTENLSFVICHAVENTPIGQVLQDVLWLVNETHDEMMKLISNLIF